MILLIRGRMFRDLTVDSILSISLKGRYGPLFRVGTDIAAFCDGGVEKVDGLELEESLFR